MKIEKQIELDGKSYVFVSGIGWYELKAKTGTALVLKRVTGKRLKGKLNGECWIREQEAAGVLV